jgi:hypothetical protein
MWKRPNTPKLNVEIRKSGKRPARPLNLSGTQEIRNGAFAYSSFALPIPFLIS